MGEAGGFEEVDDERPVQNHQPLTLEPLHIEAGGVQDGGHRGKILPRPA